MHTRHLSHQAKKNDPPQKPQGSVPQDLPGPSHKLQFRGPRLTSTLFLHCWYASSSQRKLRLGLVVAHCGDSKAEESFCERRATRGEEVCYHHHLQEGGVAWLNVSLLHLSPALVPRAQLNPRSRHRGPELFPVATIILLVSSFCCVLWCARPRGPTFPSSSPEHLSVAETEASS